MSKKKRYYKVDENVWIIEKKTHGKVLEIDLDNLNMTVEYICKDGNVTQFTGKMWDFDKLKYGKKIEVEKEINDKEKSKPLLFAKVNKNAIIPSKVREDDAGYDVWACLEPKIVDGSKVWEIFLPRFKPTLIPTGIATYVDKDFYLNFSNERGSTGKYGMLVLSGIVDSSYRGEVFINITPIYKDVLITSEVSDVEETDDLIMYPYSRAICQLIGYRIGGLTPAEITYDELKSIPSSRGSNNLGSSGN